MSAPGYYLARALSLQAGMDWLLEQTGERVFRVAGRDVMFDLAVAAERDRVRFLTGFERVAAGPVVDRCDPWFEVTP